MPIQFIGMIRTNNVSELDGPNAATIEKTIDREFVSRFARAHEEGGFDRAPHRLPHFRPGWLGGGRHMPPLIRSGSTCWSLIVPDLWRRPLRRAWPSPSIT